MKNFSFRERNEGWTQLNELTEFDLLVIGGGINGAGVARDAALRGMKVLLVEADDYASGTSSRSSKLVHGGIRYLENLEFHLVFEALSERQKLFALAPHLVHPLRFMLPLYQNGRVGMFKMGLGMWLYDALSLFQAPELHERLSALESRKRQPALQTQNLLGSYVYSDAYMDDDRLVHETLRSAHRAGAICLNFVKAIKPKLDESGKVTQVLLEEKNSRKQKWIRARHVVSTVGAWSDELGESFYGKWQKRLRPTKGVHLTFEKSRLPLSSAVVMAAESRIVFGIPRHEMVIVGTTDTDYAGDPAKVATERADVEYLLGVVARYFPGAELKESDIIASYAGVRPLVHDGAASEGKTSREHTIETDSHGLTFVMGGKYTTYRLIAEQAVLEVLRHFPIADRVRFGRSQSTAPLNPLVTEDSFAELESVKELLLTSKALDPVQVEWLGDRHGHEALTLPWQDLSYWELEAHHAIEQTMCLNLLDFYCRRVPLMLAKPDHGRGVLDSLAIFFQQRLGWSDSEREAQKATVLDFVAHEFQWKSQTSTN